VWLNEMMMKEGEEALVGFWTLTILREAFNILPFILFLFFLENIPRIPIREER
jgi:hypothetical protein